MGECICRKDMLARRCPSCGNAGGRLIFTEGIFSVTRCDDCGLAYMNSLPTHSRFKEIYDDKHRTRESDTPRIVRGVEEGRGAFYRDRMSAVIKHKKSGRLLDVGCNYGIFLKLARDIGYDVRGVDISTPAALYGKERMGLEIINGTIGDAKFPDEHFDVVTMFDVIEHVEDPIKELKGIRRVLKKDGVFFATTPNLNIYLIKARVVRFFPFLRYYKGNFPGTEFKANGTRPSLSCKPFYAPYPKIDAAEFWFYGSGIRLMQGR